MKLQFVMQKTNFYFISLHLHAIENINVRVCNNWLHNLVFFEIDKGKQVHDSYVERLNAENDKRNNMECYILLNYFLTYDQKIEYQLSI